MSESLTGSRIGEAVNSRFSVSLSRTVMPLAFALVYAFVLSNLPVDQFKDRLYYLTYASSSEIILQRYLDAGWMVALANEPLWLLINISFSKIFDPELTLRAIIFLSSFFVSFIVVRNNSAHAFWLMLFLLSPQVIKNHIIHLRQGLALSIFLIGLYSPSLTIKTILLIAAGLVHSSFIFVLAVIVLVWLTLSARISLTLKGLIILASIIALSSSFTILGQMAGARQSFGYQDGLNISGQGFLFWSLVLLLLILNGAQFVRVHLASLSILFTYLALYFSSPLAGRVFESGLLLILVSCLSLGSWRRIAFIIIYIVYALISYYNRLDQPWLGWGALT